MKLKLIVPVLVALALFAAVPNSAKAGGHSGFSIGLGYSNYGYGGGYNVGFGYSNGGYGYGRGYYGGHGYYGGQRGYYGRPYYSFGYGYGRPAYYPRSYYAPRYYAPAYYAPAYYYDDAPAPVVYAPAPAPVYRETVIYRPVETRVYESDGSVTYTSTYDRSTYRPVYQSNYNYDRR